MELIYCTKHPDKLSVLCHEGRHVCGPCIREALALARAGVELAGYIAKNRAVRPSMLAWHHCDKLARALLKLAEGGK